jgi:hypothetical protein
MQIFRNGWLVAVLLAALTVVEFIFASEVHDVGVRVTGVMAAGVLKAAFIGWFFMHIARLWKAEGAH